MNLIYTEKKKAVFMVKWPSTHYTVWMRLFTAAIVDCE